MAPLRGFWKARINQRSSVYIPPLLAFCRLEALANGLFLGKIG